MGGADMHVCEANLRCLPIVADSVRPISAALSRRIVCVFDCINPTCAPRSEVSTVALQEKSKEELASVGYHYRIWDLGGIEIAVRCEVDAVMQRQGEEHLLCTRTFNQAVLSASDVDWKRKLEHQSAAVLAMEVKNNSNRVARWTLSALLAGCDLMKARLLYTKYQASLRACASLQSRAAAQPNRPHVLTVYIESISWCTCALSSSRAMSLRHVINLCAAFRLASRPVCRQRTTQATCC